MSVATTWSVSASFDANRERMSSCTCRLDTLVGRTRSSGRPNWIRRNGRPNRIKSAVTPMAIGTGRRITMVAMRCQTPSPTGFGSRRSKRSELTLGPSTASSAGRLTTAPTPARSATPMPAYANDRKKASGNTSSAASATATVSALNATVLPAVWTVRTTASCGARPLWSSSR